MEHYKSCLCKAVLQPSQRRNGKLGILLHAEAKYPHFSHSIPFDVQTVFPHNVASCLGNKYLSEHSSFFVNCRTHTNHMKPFSPTSKFN